MNELFRKKAIALDQSDDLASFKSHFHVPEENGKPCIYLCGNSLGLQPHTTRNFVEEELKHWQKQGVQGHFTGKKPWMSYHKNSKKSLARLVGAETHEVVAMNNLTSNLHLAMSSFYHPKGNRSKILIERGAFPSDFYAVYSQILNRGCSPQENLVEIKPKDDTNYLPTQEILDKIDELGEDLALVMFAGVQYYTGQFFDLRKITQKAHEVGSYAGFDLAHAIGNIPMNLHNDEVDFAVWCSYKYLNSGPGGVGGLFIHERHGKNKNLPRLSGWWGHDAGERFKMDNQINPIPTVDGWQLSNVNILSHAALLASLRFFDEVGIHRLRAKSIKLTGLLEEMIFSSDILKEHIKIITPSNPDERGCQLSLFLLNHGKSVFDFIISKGVMLDWREPNVIRAAAVPLYNSFAEVVDFISILEESIKNEG